MIYKQTTLPKSISVSWNCTGDQLASSSHNGAKIWPTDSLSSLMVQPLATNTDQTTAASASSSTTTPTILRELTNISHDALVERVRFHPSDPSLLCTNVADNSVQFWDLRVSSNRKSGSVAKIKLYSSRGKGAASVEWQQPHGGTNVNHNYLVITEKDSAVRVHDLRKVSDHATSSKTDDAYSSSTGSTSSEVKSFSFHDCYISETNFSPSGTHLVSAAKRFQDGMGIVKVFPWQQETSDSSNGIQDTNFVCHAGPIYSLKFSPNGKYLATGGDDALVGLWDVRSMVCRATMVRRTKFIRSVGFSYDSNVLAYCSEEKGVDLADASTGADVGFVSLERKNDRDRGRSFNNGYGMSGVDEIAFHPKMHVIACARGENLASNVPQVSIAKLDYRHMS